MKYLAYVLFVLNFSPIYLDNLKITVMENTNGDFLITAVSKLSALRKWSIHKGDIILEMDGKDVTIFDLMALTKDSEPKFKIRKKDGSLTFYRIDLRHNIYYSPDFELK